MSQLWPGFCDKKVKGPMDPCSGKGKDREMGLGKGNGGNKLKGKKS